jgi:hypothetical protein
MAWGGDRARPAPGDRNVTKLRRLYARLSNLAHEALALLREFCFSVLMGYPMERDVEDWVAGTPRDYAGRDE